MGKKHYEIADRAWQPVVGCSPNMPCAPRCWARRTVARVVECQRGLARGTDTQEGESAQQRAEFFQIALTPDGQRWSGEVRLDEAHLLDPLRWRKPAVVATGFHGDWGRLPEQDLAMVFMVMLASELLDDQAHHLYMPLTKQPETLATYLQKGGTWLLQQWGMAGDGKIHIDGGNTWFHEAVMGATCHDWDAEGRNSSGSEYRPWGYPQRLLPLKNVSIGCSVMNQAEADKMLPAMRAISELGWRTHVWYEPALGPVDWTGWEFIELLIMGGESGKDARPCDPQWFRESLRWCRESNVRAFVKQLGSRPVFSQTEGYMREISGRDITDRKGSDMAEWPEDLRVRQTPEVKREGKQS